MADWSRLQRIAQERKASQPPPNFKNVGDYHGGAYDIDDFVSPYTRTARNCSSGVFVLLQDWAADQWLAGPFMPAVARDGLDIKRSTNKNLDALLKARLNVADGLKGVFGTNLMPFIKPGGMSAPIGLQLLTQMAREYAYPQIDAVKPELVVCLGLQTFNAMRVAVGLPKCSALDEAIDSHFRFRSALVHCQAHTNGRTQNVRGKVRVADEWVRMAKALAQSKTEAFNFGIPSSPSPDAPNADLVVLPATEPVTIDVVEVSDGVVPQPVEP